MWFLSNPSYRYIMLTSILSKASDFIIFATQNWKMLVPLFYGGKNLRHNQILDKYLEVSQIYIKDASKSK